MKNLSTKKLVLMALFLVLSLIGSNIRLFGSIALDSLPAFLAALLLGPGYGAAIGFMGHLFSAAPIGFPMSIPIHLAIAVAMAVTMLGFGHAFNVLKRNFAPTTSLAVTGVVGIVLNAPVSLVFTMGVMALIAGTEAAMGLIMLLPVLTLGSSINVVLSIVLYKSLEKVWEKHR